MTAADQPAVKPYVHPFNEGYRAGLDGKDNYDNPYSEDEYGRDPWWHGCETAMADLEHDTKWGEINP
jgi:ribosome modulation factor